MRRIQDLLGRETTSDSCNRALRDFAQSQRADTVGAVQVTCSDECEREQVESFQQWVADALLPELKFSARYPFRTANLGGRYEWGAVRIAEEHFATPETQNGFKLLLVKLNSHVAAIETGSGTEFGRMNRYDSASTCCGAWGLCCPARGTLPWTNCDWRSPMMTCLAWTCYTTRAPWTPSSAVSWPPSSTLASRPAVRSFNIQDYVPETPTVTIVLPTVTINRPQRDTEFVVGLYWADSRKGRGEAEYVGLGDDPSKYLTTRHHGYLCVQDDHLKQPREARDHRQEVVTQWRARHPQPQVTSDQRLRQIAETTDQTADYSARMAHETLKTVIWLAADIAPVPLTIMLFAKGLAGVHHLYRVHRLARGVDGDEQARDIIAEVSDQIPKLPVERARETIDAIVAHYQAQ